ncbi:MAG: metallophosphoesterase [Prevotella sp.]|uniref:metallophosphoesterase n=1 Tax=Prevotella sp. TaxID=59823 RepID=UPI002A2CB2EA|nr:metallophosphoesterase [Prevotella sp.]MDD7318512.1 metallophosphoesterase [Prevotellaceae bacterium]MDY4020317.1 metallophosphoesterase [Prevotella sp.]
MKMFFVLFFALLALANVYVIWHIWHIMPFVFWKKWVVAGFFTMLFVCMSFAMSRVNDNLPMPVSVMVYEFGTGWLIALLYLVIVFALLDIGRLVHLIPSSFLHASLAGTCLVAGGVGGLLIYGNIHYYNKHREAVVLKTAKPLSKSLKIVMMSDLHLGYHNRRGELARWVEMVNREKPDIVMIAGDIIDRSMRPLEDENMAEELRKINAPVFACLGNHEYYAGISGALDFYADAGITLLRDSVAVAGDVQIVGREDRSNLRRKKVAELVKDLDKGKYTVLLDHQPYNLGDAEQGGIDFQLSGHTHHGQVWPISLITDAVYECAAGRWKRGNTDYYVSSGMGIWGGKFRIGTRSEYIVVTITN